MAARSRKLVSSIFVSFFLLAQVGPVHARKGDCGQPQSDGDAVTVTDCFIALKVSIGIGQCFPRCVCDTSGDDRITAIDALLCLRKAVGQPVTLNCACDMCTSALIASAPGSSIDSGWNGQAHEKDLIVGAAIITSVARRCSEGGAPCIRGSDCKKGRCLPQCDCDDPDHSVCETVGPTGDRRCVRDLSVCTSNADCGTSGRCERFFGPPLPLSAANTPACITTFFQDDLAGTYDFQSGEGAGSAFLRSRVHLGIAFDQPCPRCGSADQQPSIGDSFTCKGGPHNGDACTVDAVSPVFGGVSNDCPPDIGSNVSGQGLAIRFRNLTTGCDEVVASIPCGAENLCVDDLSSCTTNTDCARCIGDLTPCSQNADCVSGKCATAPEQPITCGLWCHCGFCGNDPALPCTADGECAEGVRCLAGNTASGSQDRPNGCADSVCGRAEPERCCSSNDAACPEPTPRDGECSLKRYLSCDPDAPSDDCGLQSAGECRGRDLPCFGSTIERCGAPSPMGAYCVDDEEKGACSSNADCAIGECVADTAEPEFIALFCIPKTVNGGINAAGGIPGPGVLTVKSAVFFCRCGDGKVGCDEQCDDGNLTAGDGCDETCHSDS